jgi:hypothetical protein
MDILNSKDLINELKTLTSELEDIKDGINKILNEITNQVFFIKFKFDILDDENFHILSEHCELFIEANENRIDWIENNFANIEELKSVNDEGSSISSNWNIGELLIEEGSFYHYMIESELIKDLNIPDFVSVNWHETIEYLKSDYSYINYNNKKYYVRRT